MGAPDLVKENFVDNLPRRIRALNFGVAANQEIVKQGVIEVCHRELYDLSRNRAATEHGPLDRRLGLSEKSGHCNTCGEALSACIGHYGFIKLALPVLHIGYFKFIIHILQIICKSCSGILLSEDLRRHYLQELRRPNIDNLRKIQICKKISKDAKKSWICPHCEAHNGRVKKNGSGPLKITHEKFSHWEASKAKNKYSRIPPEMTVFEASFERAKKVGVDVERNFKKALDDLNPLRILNLFEKISNPDCELLGMNPKQGRPEMFIWRDLPVPPICIRPSVQQESATTEDDLTTKLGDICDTNKLIRKGLNKGERVGTLMEQWDFLQAQVAMLVNSEAPGITAPGQYVTMRGFCQRLKGKQGRFRGNLSGKRVDFSGRTVISPDPNIGVDEVAIPEHVAKIMTFPEKVTKHNLAKMQEAIRRGPRNWPGANRILKAKGNMVQHTKYAGSKQAEGLRIGDTVERHLIDGDIVLFNRQPSLHKLSIMSHTVRVRPTRTFRLNECVCNPYNADFDGDEMNLHVPQTVEAKVEASELMGVKHNLATPRNGEPIIAAIQDFITGAYLLSNKDNFFDRKSFTQLCMSMVEGNDQIDLPIPAIFAPTRLWTGKQVFDVWLRPNKACNVRVSLDAPCRAYRKQVPEKEHRDLMEDDSWLCVRDSQIMCGVLDKSTVGAGKKESIFFSILHDYGEDEALKAMNRLARLISRYLSSQGFSIGVSDVKPGVGLTREKNKLIEQAYANCDDLIAQYRQKSLQSSGAHDEEQSLEKDISNQLTKVRKEAGEHCSNELSQKNAALVMAVCGSKGTTINVSQMVTLVGQQIINQERVQEGFSDRTLPHFPRNSRQPPSKGFVRNSFYSGLTPSELFFHAMSGREGLVDTAVKTAETGYMSRRLMKSLEDVSIQYDLTVRNSTGALVQFRYGDDALDPTSMEGKATPVDLDHAYTHIEALMGGEEAPNLARSEIMELCEKILQRPTDHLSRSPLLPSEVSLDVQLNNPKDDFNGERVFIKSVKEYVRDKAEELNADSNTVTGISRQKLLEFAGSCLDRYEKSRVQPGAAVGAIAAQSIGEPGTQMTLKTFHFAGIANLQITQGVPRMKEIINASKDISTPIINCKLHSTKDEIAARIVKGRIEQTFVKDVTDSIANVWSDSKNYLELKLDMDLIHRLQLDINADHVRKCILKAKKLQLKDFDVMAARGFVRIDARPNTKGKIDDQKDKDSKDGVSTDQAETFARALNLSRLLPDVPVAGYANAVRATIKYENEMNSLVVEGYGLMNCMTTEGVDFRHTTANSIVEARDVLGIEGARQTIIREISSVMGDMEIDPRHMQLLGDVMTYRGEVLGITRFGLSKMRDSVLQLASFEKTTDHLFEAAWHAKRDKIEGVSECIIMGQTMNQGTGAFQVVYPFEIPKDDPLMRKKTVFEDAWASLQPKAR